MIKIYCHIFNQPLSPERFDTYLKKIPVSFRKKIRRYRKWEDQHRAIFGKLLLLKGLSEHYPQHLGLENMQYNKMKKPKLSDDFSFNISHAGDIVLCGFVEKAALGVDVEILKPVEIEDYEFIFDADTYRQLRQAHHQEGAFFEAWTIREAILKAQGNGLTEDAKKIKYRDGIADFDDKTWYVKPIPVGHGHIAHLATDRPVESVQLIPVQF